MDAALPPLTAGMLYLVATQLWNDHAIKTFDPSGDVRVSDGGHGGGVGERLQRLPI